MGAILCADHGEFGADDRSALVIFVSVRTNHIAGSQGFHGQAQEAVGGILYIVQAVSRNLADGRYVNADGGNRIREFGLSPRREQDLCGAAGGYRKRRRKTQTRDLNLARVIRRAGDQQLQAGGMAGTAGALGKGEPEFGSLAGDGGGGRRGKAASPAFERQKG